MIDSGFERLRILPNLRIKSLPDKDTRDGENPTDGDKKYGTIGKEDFAMELAYGEDPLRFRLLGVTPPQHGCQDAFPTLCKCSKVYS